MSTIFQQHANSNNIRGCFSLGKPEAEYESSPDYELSIKKLFVDEMNILTSINNGAFIVTGRKGTGKSAIKSFIQLNSFPYDTYLRSYDLNPNYLKYDVLKDEISDFPLRITKMSQWGIITSLLKLILETEQGQATSEIQTLQKLRRKYFELFTLEDILNFGSIEKRNISFNLLKTPFGALFSKEEMRDNTKPRPFYHFIDRFISVLGKVLQMEVFKDYVFKILIDNLDVNFNLYNDDDRIALMTLIRAARDFNNNPQIRNHAQVIIFLRDDVKRFLEGMSADSSKIFNSYALPLIWYEGKDIPDNKLKLKQFINKRIEENFKVLGKDYYKPDPWRSYVDEYDNINSRRSIFRSILDYTFFRPRDLINLFLPLDTADYTLPLRITELKGLIKKYSEKVFAELKDELQTKYPPDKKQLVLDLIANIARKDAVSDCGITYEQLIDLLPSPLDRSVIQDLYDYDVIGYIDNNNDKHFHCRGSLPTISLENCAFTLTRIIKLYYDRSLQIRL
ncbi:MAG: hypothetical protein Q4C34_07720 [Bacteroidales bacterium]|nr:hypothetical protein [Bacteroidales bacterium]